MSKNLENIVAKIKEVRMKKRPEVDAKMKAITELRDAVRTTETLTNAILASDEDLKSSLGSMRYSEVVDKLDAANKLAMDAMDRLSRDSINIGVAGLSGQGKSMILRMLTGLGKAQIPTGDAGACTAVRSVVHNSLETKAVIHFLTGTSLLEKKVWPSFKPNTEDFGLGIAPRPDTLEEFLKLDLSSLVPESDEEAAKSKAQENWDRVKEIQKALNSDPELKSWLGQPPKQVEFNSVSDWLVKDGEEKTKHNVVDYVEIWTPFEMGLPQGLTVLDIPGLGDPTPGIKDDMRASLKYKADIVFFMRKAAKDGSRDFWSDMDHEAFNMIKDIYPENQVRPRDWVQLIMNKDTRNNPREGDHRNESNTERLAKIAPRGFRPVICDCGSKECVRSMVDEHIEELVSQVGTIDQLRIDHANAAFRLALTEASTLLDKLTRANANLVASQPDLKKLLKSLERKFRGDLQSPFDAIETKSDANFKAKAEEVLSGAFRNVEAVLNQMYSEHGEADEFPAEFPAFSKKRILEEFRQEKGPGEAENVSVRNQREAVLKLLRNELSKCCQSLIDGYFDCVVRMGFDQNPPLCRIAPPPANGSEDSKTRIERFLAALRKSENGRYLTLDDAVSDLLRFSLTFDNSILPAIYRIDEINDFVPTIRGRDLDVNLKTYNASLDESLGRTEEAKEKKAMATFNWLKLKSESIVNKATSGSEDSPLTIIAEHIANMMRANFDSFVFRFIWGDDCDDDWSRFIEENKHKLWPKEFEEAMANSQRAQKWNDAVRPLADAIQKAQAI